MSVSNCDRTRAAVETLRDGDVVLGDGDLDYAAADLLEVLVALHEQGRINLEILPAVEVFSRMILGCRECGCTDARGCLEGCWWVEPDLCSSCAPKAAS